MVGSNRSSEGVETPLTVQSISALDVVGRGHLIRGQSVEGGKDFQRLVSTGPILLVPTQCAVVILMNGDIA